MAAESIWHMETVAEACRPKMGKEKNRRRNFSVTRKIHLQVLPQRLELRSRGGASFTVYCLRWRPDHISNNCSEFLFWGFRTFFMTVLGGCCWVWTEDPHSCVLRLWSRLRAVLLCEQHRFIKDDLLLRSGQPAKTQESVTAEERTSFLCFIWGKLWVVSRRENACFSTVLG